MSSTGRSTVGFGIETLSGTLRPYGAARRCLELGVLIVVGPGPLFGIFSEAVRGIRWGGRRRLSADLSCERRAYLAGAKRQDGQKCHYSPTL